MKVRYLTKSRFKLARECPAKLFYTRKDEYADKKIEDSFLEALAKGGYQVGELAKCYYPGGHNIASLDYEEALKETNELLEREQVTIFEAAIRYKSFFIRVDILVKNGKHIELIEVKAKSFNSSDSDVFFGKKGGLVGKWKPYLEDVAFQKYVITKAFPKYFVSAFLMIANKDSLCPTDGLNQKFKCKKDKDGRLAVTVSPDISQEDISKRILSKVNVNECCETIYEENYGDENEPLSFGELVDMYAEYYAADRKFISPITKSCKDCEFRATEEKKAKGLKSGYEECFKERLGWTDADFLEPNIFEIWDFRKKDEFIQAGRMKIAQLTESDLSVTGSKKAGISRTERQWLQVKKVQAKDDTYWMDKEGLAFEMSKWVYPLHFIDFETSAVAIPFNKGRHPYEGIAFQFSHHVVYQDGTIEHHGEYLNTVPGTFPNYDFIRYLKKELEGDNGSIFRYTSHENTYLNHIHRQLQADINSVPDSRELIDFIRSITHSSSSSLEKWKGERDMLDLWEFEKQYYYDPATKGSNSIKAVLPAILNSSEYLQKKYSAPIYGTEGGIKSLNYNNWKWIEYDEDGKVKDPYYLLPKLFADYPDEYIAMLEENLLFSDSDELHDGGAALTAYARLQFEEMIPREREELEKALLKYCELDTFAMVMIYEGWREMIGAF